MAPNDPKRILCIDDDPDISKLIDRFLAKRGFEVAHAADGMAGLGRAFNEPFDLILCDIMMPHMDGFDVCTELHEDERTKDIPLIFMTARGGKEGAFRAKRLGAAHYLTKPFQLSELMEKISDALDP